MYIVEMAIDNRSSNKKNGWNCFALFYTPNDIYLVEKNWKPLNLIYMQMLGEIKSDFAFIW